MCTIMRMFSGYNINDLFQEAQTRWLKPAEVLYILQNNEKFKLAPEPPQQPSSKSPFGIVVGCHIGIPILVVTSTAYKFICPTFLWFCNRWIFVSF